MLLACVFALAAQTQPLNLDQYALPNGLQVVLYENHALPMVAVNIMYHVGSKDEPDRHSGFAHLFEHLMFMGTNRVPTGQYDKIMEGGGGWNNADTSEDRTDFYDVGPSNLLPTLLWLEADRLETLGKDMTQKKLDLQRDVVKNERRQTTENTPYGKAYEALNGLMFPPLHPYHTSVIGSMQDLDNASVQDVQNFFATYYIPNNATMVIAGDFNSTTVKQQIATLFGTLPRQSDVQRKFVPPAHFEGVKRLTFVDAVESSKVIMAWHSTAKYHSGDAELNLAASVLSDGVSSRLYQRLVVKDKLATDVSVYNDDRLLGGMFNVDATAAPGASLDRLEADVLDELHKLKQNGPTKAELQREVAKQQFAIANSRQSIADFADALNEYWLFLGRPDGFQYLMDSYRAVTPESMRQWLIKTVTPDDRLVLRVVPQSKEQAGLDPREARRSYGSAKPFVAPEPAQFTLSNGLKVAYWYRPSAPLVAVSLQVRRGADLDAAAKQGLASLTAQMLTQGAATRNAQEYENALGQLGATVSAAADERSIDVNLNVLSSNFAPALKLYGDAILRPRFDGAEFARVKRVQLANIEDEKDDPAQVAGKVLARLWFGADHPLGRPVEGTTSSVKSIAVADLHTEYRRFFQPQNCALFAAGSLHLAEAKAQLELALKSWSNSGAALPAPTYGQPPLAPERLVIVDRPGAVQTVVRFVFPAPTYSSPDREPLTSLGTVLGGSFTSRLNQNLREDKGYTYGAGSSFAFTPQVGTLRASADVRADVTGASLKEFLKEFARISTGDVSDAEASKTALSRRQNAINSIESLDGLIAVAEGYSENGRTFHAFDDELAASQAVTATQMNALAAGALPLDHALIVLVGDKATILKQLDGLGLPAPEFVTP
jgi:predicted Zn-dependent peptidase